MNSLLKNLIVAIAIVLIGFFLQAKYIRKFPSSIHAWAQSDHYALAKGFIHNGFNFFKPETFVYNHQFPYDWKIISEESVTAVDFPIHDYVPALIMKISGRHTPAVFRFYTLLYSFLGLFFLHKIAELFTRDLFKSLLVVLIAATSPVFVYYQAGFLPTIPSFANAIIAVYFYAVYLQTDNKRKFNYSILFFTLAALSRTTFAIPLIAVFCHESLRILQRKTELRHKLIPAVLSVGVLLFYFLYNTKLRNTYGSIFLNYFLPANSLEEFKNIIVEIVRKWKSQYFTLLHYLIILVVLSSSFLLLIAKKVSLSPLAKSFLLFTLIVFTGCFLFFILMAKQFPEHDYYFLDTFFLPVLLVLILLLPLLPTSGNKPYKISSGLILLAFAFVLTIQASRIQEIRYTKKAWDKTEKTIDNFYKAEEILDEANIPKNAKILVMDAVAPNIPFLLMNRKGFALLTTNKEDQKNALTWPYDYVVFQNEFFLTDLYKYYPEIITEIEKIYDNGIISICKRRKEKQSDRDEFITFEGNQLPNWSNIKVSEVRKLNGEKSGIATPEMEFGVTFKTGALPVMSLRKTYLFVSGWFYRESDEESEIVISLKGKDSIIYYGSYDLKKLKMQNWEKAEQTFQLPLVKDKEYEFGVYIWNRGKGTLYYDDFGFRMF
jgi:hypothetical protein